MVPLRHHVSWLFRQGTLAAALGLVGLGAGCSAVGPDYERPEIEAPDAWKTAVTEELADDDSGLETWWTRFNDPELERLIDMAVEANLDLKNAAARVTEAREQIGIAAGLYYPQTVVDASYQRQRTSERGLFAGGQTFSTSTAGVGFGWELDVFGRIRRNVEAAEAFTQASVEDYRDVLVILLADVASTYVDVRTLQTRLSYARSNAESQAATVRLTQDRFDAGLTSARDVAQAEANLATTEAAIPSLERALEFAFNRLSVLLGAQPGAVDEALAPPAAIPEPDEDILLEVPAELLRRRPDVRAAERRLAGQTALIGVATAELYPVFSLDGSLGLQAIDGSLFESGNQTWSLAPGVQWNIFSGGLIQSQIRAEKARTEQALLGYEQAVLLALEDVENALIAYEREQIRRDRLQRAVDASVRALDLVRTQYRSGLADFQSYLDSERVLFGQQDDLAASEGQVVLNLVALNRALGGGWPLSEADDEAVDDEDTSRTEP